VLERESANERESVWGRMVHGLLLVLL